LISSEGKPDIPGSSDPHFRGDRARWNPEELLVAALCACHQLAYLHLCAVNDIVVTAYEDEAQGVMVEERDGAGQFAGVVLRPTVTITAKSDPEKARRLHHDAHELCFIARSVNFPVTHEPVIIVEAQAGA
jgi:organic hydroperoxide reductase OsmC/OhrA